jgi:hypothetical protein
MTVPGVPGAVSLSHLRNDALQSLPPAISVLKVSFGLTFAQIGFMTLALMLTASLLQPAAGCFTDNRLLRTRSSWNGVVAGRSAVARPGLFILDAPRRRESRLKLDQPTQFLEAL